MAELRTQQRIRSNRRSDSTKNQIWRIAPVHPAAKPKTTAVNNTQPVRYPRDTNTSDGCGSRRRRHGLFPGGTHACARRIMTSTAIPRDESLAILHYTRGSKLVQSGFRADASVACLAVPCPLPPRAARNAPRPLSSRASPRRSMICPHHNCCH